MSFAILFSSSVIIPYAILWYFFDLIANELRRKKYYDLFNSNFPIKKIHDTKKINYSLPRKLLSLYQRQKCIMLDNRVLKNTHSWHIIRSVFSTQRKKISRYKINVSGKRAENFLSNIFLCFYFYFGKQINLFELRWTWSFIKIFDFFYSIYSCWEIKINKQIVKFSSTFWWEGFFDVWTRLQSTTNK
jgi:hypothetical protein